ncbi:site-specific integrase [Magnetospirillum sp. XM-1]|uniref:tyrosine-type recombinase/integrase n=1 Tax=Magnetospirillum sp. XM-1 TaxID=1663591 RepID=UPI0009EC1F78|nr:site-specific integrase [Magnetospirillum sp. XM-1]
MAKVTKRTWTTGAGEARTAWRLSYYDRDGQRHMKQFARKADAEAERVLVEGQLATGLHVPDKASITVLDAAKAFLADFADLVQSGKRERSSLEAYRRQVKWHLEPYAVAALKLSRLTGPDCVTYGRALEASVSDAMATRVFAMFRLILKHAQGAGWIASNPGTAVSIRTSGEREDEGVEIPPKAALKALWEAAAKFDSTGRATAMVALLMFGGLRASELRGLPRRDLLLSESKVRVSQRADNWQKIGTVKSKKSRRSVTLPPAAVVALKRWVLAVPKNELGLIFPTGAGTVESYANIYHRTWVPLMVAAGLADVEKREGEDDYHRPHFALHALRHVAVSLWIEQGASPKQVSTWAGHASIQFTMDRYGHLWDDPVGAQAIARGAERSIIG